ncbi:hypothetical protein [Enterobacter sp. R4-368]|uniref:hypothetical protein n=1 Tax=Enterobacter sp. R4-368 TaxID=1166130 RepID=UPI00034F0EA3|nr:hypothetical protein [Enterobacter sp. R4-368]AGN84205.1 hypothetical protein H650_03060 [Enterobacter sp. R4-368]
MKSKLAHLDNIIFYTLCAAPLLLLIILGCKLLALVYNYSSPDFGSWPDWLSWITNLFIAFITIVVARNAKDFFSERIHAEGFNRASILMDNIDVVYKKHNSLSLKVLLDVRRLAGSTQTDDPYRVHYQKVIESAENSLEEITALYADIANIKTSMDLLSRWSLASNQEEIFNSFINAFTESLGFMYEIAHYISYIDYPDDTISPKEYIERIERHQHIKDDLAIIYRRFATTPLNTLFGITEKRK